MINSANSKSTATVQAPANTGSGYLIAIRVLGDHFLPEVKNGQAAVFDLGGTRPTKGQLAAVYVEGEGEPRMVRLAEDALEPAEVLEAATWPLLRAHTDSGVRTLSYERIVDIHPFVCTAD